MTLYSTPPKFHSQTAPFICRTAKVAVAMTAAARKPVHFGRMPNTSEIAATLSIAIASHTIAAAGCNPTLAKKAIDPAMFPSLNATCGMKARPTMMRTGVIGLEKSKADFMGASLNSRGKILCLALDSVCTV